MQRRVKAISCKEVQEQKTDYLKKGQLHKNFN